MANAPTSIERAEPETLASDEQGIGTLGIILIVILVLLVFGVIGFSFNS